MTKVQIAVPKREEENLLRWLQEKEVLHVTATHKNKANSAGEGELNYQLAQLQFALEFIGRVKKDLRLEEKRSIRHLFAAKPQATLERLEQVWESLETSNLLEEIRQRNDLLVQNRAKHQEIIDAEKEVAPWQGLKITGKEMRKSGVVRHYLLSVSVQESLLVKKRMQNIGTLALNEVGRLAEKKGGTVYLEVVVHNSEADKLIDVIQQTNTELITLDVPDQKTVSEYADGLKQQVDNLAAEEVRLLEGAEKFVKLERQLKFAYDALLHHKERLTTRQTMGRLSLAVIISGWIPQRRLEKFTEDLKKYFPTACIEQARPGKKEKRPVLFDNKPYVQPFEVVTDIYGKPKYNELDPSPALSIFFLVAFGLALTDAGYGIVMMLLMWAAGKFFRLKKSMRKMIRLLFYAGASTLIFGALTGGWFGINLGNLPKSDVRDLLLSVKLLDPVSSPMTLLLVAFAVGIMQLLFAWVVRGYDHWRQKQYVAVLFDDVAWITMIIFLLTWAGSARGVLSTSLSGPLLNLVLVNAGILILTQGRSYKNPLLKVGVGVLSLYGLVSFLSDTLSYSRLLALGLATGIIALVVNMISGMVVDSIPIVGYLLAAVVLLVGHVFNLGINALGAFIHSGRLQFVEFFPKFLEGGGESYKPLGRVSHYVDNPNEFV
ncbi:MAG: V-type ATP synthase subunit I [bacterium]